MQSVATRSPHFFDFACLVSHSSVMSMFTCFTSACNQRAIKINGRSVMMKPLNRGGVFQRDVCDHLVFGAHAVAADFTTLNVLQLQLGDEIFNVGGAFDVILVAEDEQGDAREGGL